VPQDNWRGNIIEDLLESMFQYLAVDVLSMTKSHLKHLDPQGHAQAAL
jgi:hypothetical protein